MHDLLIAEQLYREHYARTAIVDREGWKKPQPAARPYHLPKLRATLAKALLALAIRLAPAPPETTAVTQITHAPST